MRRVEVTKYYSHGRCSSIDSAQDEIEKLKKKHPDRDYTILINMRAVYKRYVVAQVQTLVVPVPEDKDLDLPPEPVPPKSALSPANKQEWADYRHERERRQKARDLALAPVQQALRGKMNP